MNELIKIENLEGNNVVFGRELCEKLEIKTPYTQWFHRMCEYGFQAEKDYNTVSQKCEIVNGGYQEKIDHIISLDMAKEICMIQRSEVGKKFRNYFIECEKKLKQPLALPAAIENKLNQIEKAIDSIHESLQGEVIDEPRSFRSTCGCSVYQYEKKIDELRNAIKEKCKEVNKLNSLRSELEEAFRYILYEAKDLCSVKKTAEKAYELLDRSPHGFYICF